MLPIVIIEVPNTSIQVGGGRALEKLLLEFYALHEIGRGAGKANDGPPREAVTVSGIG